MRNKRAGSISSRILDKFLDDLGITREHIEKATQLWDKVDIVNTDDGIEINIKLKNIQVKIDTEN